MTGPKPLSRQRSQWESAPTSVLGVPATLGRRRVADGTLRVIAANEPAGWHLSISFTDHKGKPSRYPRWDEITDARYRFAASLVPLDVEMVMHLPPPGEYVAVHDSTFHLHEMVSQR